MMEYFWQLWSLSCGVQKMHTSILLSLARSVFIDAFSISCLTLDARHGREPLHMERKYGNLGREEVRDHAMADALAELIVA
jgi:hypothetical protein